jgi:hypothetical protein
MVSFDGTAGLTVRLLLNSSLSAATLLVNNPDGSNLYTGGLAPNGSIVTPSALPTTGTYTILVEAGSGVSGSVGMYVTTTLSNDYAIFQLPSFTRTDIAQPSYNVYVSYGSSFSGTVNLSVTNCPTGATCSFSPGSVTGTSVSTLTVNPGTAAGGTCTLTVQGTSSVNHSTTATLKISPVPSPWTDQDVGSVGIPGLGQYVNPTFTAGGSGGQINGTADGFHFVSQSLNGDGTIVARIATVFNAVKAGVMIRETLTAGASNMFVGLSGASLQFQYRNGTGASTNVTTGAVVGAPYWFELVRSGNNLSAYASGDGNNWVQQGATQTIPMATSVFVGLAVSSENSSQVTTATFDGVSVIQSGTSADFNLTVIPLSITVAPGGSLSYPKVFVNPISTFTGAVSLSATVTPTGPTMSFSPSSITGSGSSTLTLTTAPAVASGNYTITITGTSGTLTHTASLTLTVSATGVSLPAPWANQDVGVGGPADGATYSNGVLTLTGTGCGYGCGLSGSVDSFQFSYQTMTGDGTIIARVLNTLNFSGSAK